MALRRLTLNDLAKMAKENSSKKAPKKSPTPVKKQRVSPTKAIQQAVVDMSHVTDKLVQVLKETTAISEDVLFQKDRSLSMYIGDVVLLKLYQMDMTKDIQPKTKEEYALELFKQVIQGIKEYEILGRGYRDEPSFKEQMLKILRERSFSQYFGMYPEESMKKGL